VTDFLEQVARERRAYVAAARAVRPLDEVERAARTMSLGRGLLRLSTVVRELRRSGRLAVIAEVKRVSPALGPLAEIADAGRLARTYIQAGACAVSVLVEPHHWGGSLADLRTVRSVERGIGYTGAILAKDVVVDAYQIAEVGAAGADVVLLVTELFSTEELRRLRLYAESLGMDALVEAHDPAAFARAVACGASLLGVNARDLREPSRIDRGRIHQLASQVPEDGLLVAESGITSVEDAEALPARVDAVLVGTALVREPDPGPLVHALATVVPGSRALA